VSPSGSSYSANLGLGRYYLNRQLNRICREGGSIMRLDHTYKVTKSLTAYSYEDKRQVRLRGSLLIIMDEKGMVMGFKICPNDEVLHLTIQVINDLYSTFTSITWLRRS
jgi:hypothetical protein